MFTVEQIRAAHARVKSGADFPAYINEIKALGVTHYEAYVSDGHIDYHGQGNETVTVPGKYEPLTISDTVSVADFKAGLTAHQQGKTDYMGFIRMCSETGIEKWNICMDKMTCTYYDISGNEVLVESIPE